MGDNDDGKPPAKKRCSPPSTPTSRAERYALRAANAAERNALEEFASNLASVTTINSANNSGLQNLKTEVGGMGELLRGLATSVDLILERLEGLERDVDALQRNQIGHGFVERTSARLNEHNLGLRNVATRVDRLGQRCDTIDANVDRLQATATTASRRFGRIEAGDLTGRVASLENSVAAVHASRNEIQDLQDRMHRLDLQVAREASRGALSERMDGFARTLQVTNGRLESNTNSLRGVSERINSLSSEVGNLSGLVTDAVRQHCELRTDVRNLQSNSASTRIVAAAPAPVISNSEFEEDGGHDSDVDTDVAEEMAERHISEHKSDV